MPVIPYQIFFMQQTMLVQTEPRIASEIIEVQVANGTSRAPLPDVPQLRNQGDQVIIIKSIRLITPKVLTHGPNTGTVNTPLADLKKMSLVLYSNGWEKGHLIPVLLLNDVADADSTAATTIPYRQQSTRLSNWTDVDWNKSYLQFSTNLTASQASVTILEVEYVRMSKQIIDGKKVWAEVKG